MNSVHSKFKPLSDAQIDAFEKRTGVRLPSNYRSFLKRNNGGAPERDLFTVPDGWGDSVVQSFYGIQPGEPYDLEKRRYGLRGRFPSRFLAIADDPAGNIILMAVSGSGSGKIYLWDHENEPPSEKSTEKVEDYPNIHFVADSLEAFLEEMKEDVEQ